MRITAFSTLALGFGVAALQLGACSNSADDCEATASCSGASGGTAGAGGKSNSGGASGSGTEAGADGSGSSNGGNAGMSGTPNGGVGANGEAGGGGTGLVVCTGDVADDPTCWTTDEYGVFVSSDTGSDDTGDGTQANPFATISQGLSAATAAGKAVYVCRGDNEYREQLIITDQENDGVHIYGGFECEGWTYSKTRMVLVEADENIALRLKDLKQGVLIENVSFLAAPGSGTQSSSMSSYGAFITNSKNVVLRRVDISAGAGADGVSPMQAAKGANGSAAGAAPLGTDGGCGGGTPAGGKWGVESSCGSQGGPGGTASKATGTAPSGTVGFPSTDVVGDIDNAGPGESTNVTIFDGKVGASGLPGTPGPAAPTEGTFGTGGYEPANGSPGILGHTGQGGGGGGASKGNGTCPGASGGAGGMGGCGGLGGATGGGGGASIGVLSWNSEVILSACTITSAAGGAGGNGGQGGGGGAGASGGSGGAEDSGLGIKAGGSGGKGGTGGNGGSGSGGTGGPSYPIAHKGMAPVYDPLETTLTSGLGGDAGIGGQVLTEKASDGTPGDSLEVFEVP